MIWIASMLIATVLCAGGVFVGRAIRRQGAPDSPQAAQGLMILSASVVLWVLWVALHTAFATTRQVEAGHVAIVYEFGSIVGQRSEGLEFILPWQETRTESTQVQRERFENINAFSAETQDVFIISTINFSVAPGAVQDLYREVGPDWFGLLVEPRVNDFFKQEVVKYEAVEVAPNREAIRQAVKARLLGDLQNYSITVVDLLIDNIDFQPEFKVAIEAKQIATQDALREQERIKQRQAEADQQIELARGDAESVRIRAEGQAAANNAIAQSITPEVIQFTAVQTLSDNIQIALIPSGEGIIIDPAALLGSVPTDTP